jgi:hypothetical protein
MFLLATSLQLAYLIETHPHASHFSINVDQVSSLEDKGRNFPPKHQCQHTSLSDVKTWKTTVWVVLFVRHKEQQQTELAWWHAWLVCSSWPEACMNCMCSFWLKACMHCKCSLWPQTCMNFKCNSLSKACVSWRSFYQGSAWSNPHQFFVNSEDNEHLHWSNLTKQYNPTIINFQNCEGNFVPCLSLLICHSVIRVCSLYQLCFFVFLIFTFFTS